MNTGPKQKEEITPKTFFFKIKTMGVSKYKTMGEYLKAYIGGIDG